MVPAIPQIFPSDEKSYSPKIIYFSTVLIIEIFIKWLTSEFNAVVQCLDIDDVR